MNMMTCIWIRGWLKDLMQKESGYQCLTPFAACPLHAHHLLILAVFVHLLFQFYEAHFGCLQFPQVNHGHKLQGWKNVPLYEQLQHMTLMGYDHSMGGILPP